MTHVSRFSEELILWMSPARRLHRPGRPLLHRLVDHAAEEESGRARTGARQDRPRLRPPDGLLTLMKGQPLAYNKDNQEDKEPLFDTADTLIDTLRIFADLVPGIRVKSEAMAAALRQGYATATDLADYLVKKGLPFRDAHEAVARAVRACEDARLRPGRPDAGRVALLFAAGGEDAFAVLTVAGSLAARNHLGGTAPAQVAAAIVRSRARL
jgi:argininosuccinate lyase